MINWKDFKRLVKKMTFPKGIKLSEAIKIMNKKLEEERRSWNGRKRNDDSWRMC